MRKRTLKSESIQKKKLKQDSLLGKGQLGQHSYSTLEGRLMIIESQ